MFLKFSQLLDEWSTFYIFGLKLIMAKTLKHEQKLDALLEKGLMLLWSNGYNATSVNDIVQAAGVPKGSFYFYFDSKEDFAVKAIEKYFNMMFPPALSILKNPGVGPKQRLMDFYEHRTHVLKHECNCSMGCMGSNLASEMGEHSEAIRQAISKKTETVKAHIQEVVEEAQEYGEIDKTVDPRGLVNFLEDAGRGAMVSMKEMSGAYPIDNFMNMLRYILK